MCNKKPDRAVATARSGLGRPWATDSPLPAQLLACDRVYRAAFRASLELRNHSAHHRANVGGAAGDRRAHRGADLFGVDLCRKITLERRKLRPFLRHEVVPLCRKIKLDCFPAALDRLSYHVHDVVVRELATLLDLPVAGVGNGGADYDHRRLVTPLSSRVEVLLKSREESCPRRDMGHR